eukprot:364595-Chlamydomonas_euryale.AAC.7
MALAIPQPSPAGARSEPSAVDCILDCICMTAACCRPAASTFDSDVSRSPPCAAAAADRSKARLSAAAKVRTCCRVAGGT